MIVAVDRGTGKVLGQYVDSIGPDSWVAAQGCYRVLTRDGYVLVRRETVRLEKVS